MNSHLPDRELLMGMDGELAARDAARVEKHLEACWTCRARRTKLEQAISEFVQVHRGAAVPSADGPRALLRAQLAEEAKETPPRSLTVGILCGALSAVVAVGIAIGMLGHKTQVAGPVVPNPSLTPGAALLVSRNEVCREPQPNNKEVPVALQKRVMEEYGLRGSEARAFEVDYLITPALGGADDIHNIWPEPYSAGPWNARVKDALEQRLRMMVCEGELDLATAQREIASNWIEAYKKYFMTDRPIGDGRR